MGWSPARRYYRAGGFGQIISSCNRPYPTAALLDYAVRWTPYSEIIWLSTVTSVAMSILSHEILLAHAGCYCSRTPASR